MNEVRGPLEVWAGIECSYNRVGDRYNDQLLRGGTYDRPEDIDRLASLGVTAVRFPVLWERVAALGERAFEWVDEALERLRSYGIVPVVGLMHHGSGPQSTSLVDPAFPAQFAAFARTIAERYPWVERYTPINEPLTTARFAALYGYWSPHAASEQAFARAIVGQCRATGLAMRAIREVTPGALLIQTEDLGKTHARRALRYQAEFENERRWLTFDLLCGEVTGHHPMAAYLEWAGVSRPELNALANASCPPDIIGINHYLTSERYLDDRIEGYPEESHGGNHRHRYADVEAVRVLGDGIAGPYALLREACDRYHLPIAVTEAHLGCTREHQLRWLDEVWHAALRLRAEGADVRAVTAWSAFGAHDWASLLTREDGSYEPGLFDIRSPVPRPTALAQMVRSLAMCNEFDHPALHAPGWWRCDARLQYPAATSPATARPSARSALHGLPARTDAHRLLVVGANGTLGRAMLSACRARGLPHVGAGRLELDIADEDAVGRAFAEMRPWAVVNCAGFVRVDDAERERSACRRANVRGPSTLANACAEHGARLVTFSTDLVFDGEKGSPYVESDAIRPLCEYGHSKADAERAVLAANHDALVVRTAAFFGDDDHNFVTQALRALAGGHPFVATQDVVVSPTYVPDLVDAVLDLLIDSECGVWHVANEGATTWQELAIEAARKAGVSTKTLRGVPLSEMAVAAPRPRYAALASERGKLLPSLDSALDRYSGGRSWARHSPAVAVPAPVAPDGDDADVPLRAAISSGRGLGCAYDAAVVGAEDEG